MMRMGDAFGVTLMMFVIFGPLSLLLYWLLPEARSNPILLGFGAFSAATLLLLAEEPLRRGVATLRGRRFIPLTARAMALTLLGLGFLAPGVALAGSELGAWIEDLRLDGAPKAAGVVLSVQEVPNTQAESNGTVSAPVAVAFTYGEQGHRATCYEWLDDGQAPRAQGDAVAVEHVPETPGLARIEGTGRSATRFLLAIGVVFSLLGGAIVALGLRSFRAYVRRLTTPAS